jgi:hypothetical protein
MEIPPALRRLLIAVAWAEQAYVNSAAMPILPCLAVVLPLSQQISAAIDRRSNRMLMREVSRIILAAASPRAGRRTAPPTFYIAATLKTTSCVICPGFVETLLTPH